MNARHHPLGHRLLRHLTCFLVLVCCLPQSAAAQNRWDEMDYGSFLASSVTMPGANPEDPAGIIEKGVTVRLGTKDHPAAICFDTDLLCYRAGWTGGWLKLMGTPFDGTHRPPEGSRPMPQGEIAVSAESGPGWASPDGNWNDPRARPYGPLPKSWGKYKGMYVHGDKVVFAYTVNGTDVLDHPSFERDGDTWQPGSQVWVEGDKWGPFAGHLLHLSYGKCDLFHVMHEEVGGTVQGGVVRFPLQFDSGVMRARFNPADGQLYVAGLKGWQTEAPRDGCLQRVRYTGKPVHTAHAMKVTSTGLDLTFTRPLDPVTAADPDSYAVERWNYLWSREYGSPELKVSDPADQGRDAVEVKSAKLSRDGRTVSLELADHQPSMQLMTQCNLESADGISIEIEIYSTINHVPSKP